MIKKHYTAAAAMLMVMGMCASASAAFDEDLEGYTLDSIVVEADAIKNKFGDTITEQSYYRTGGDVKVITREEIEKRHYVDVTDALKRIPGVTFRNPGYRGSEYGSNSYANSIEINGDSHVIVLLDGRRVDNSASQRFGTTATRASKGTADVNQLVNMESIDKIEVIKGPGASHYGADSTGGVINIITRKGAQGNKGTIDLATGSWNRHLYNISYSGSCEENDSMHYFISATRNMSGNSKYKDGVTGENHTYEGTKFKAENVNARIDKDFNDKQSLKIWYNHQNEHDGYPITARDWRYWNQKDWDAMVDRYNNEGLYGDDKNPGYRNFFSLDALAGSYNANRNNDVDISYTFDKDNGMESFVRVYSQDHTYYGRDVYPVWTTGVGFPGNPGFNQYLKDSNLSLKPTRFRDEKNRGIQIQHGKAVGVNDILVSATFDRSKVDTRSYSKKNDAWTTTSSERETIQAYVQDKIHVSDKWDVTPSLRYYRYSSFQNKAADGTTTEASSASEALNTSLNTQYMFDDTSSIYAGWTPVKRPLKNGDYTLADSYLANGPLKDEKGNVFTIGARKDVSEKLSMAVHYDYTDMSNAVARYSVKTPNTGDNYKILYMNAEEVKKSFNINADYSFDDKWNFSLAYSHLNDKLTAKDGVVMDPDFGLDKFSDVNAFINKLRPQNHYIANLSYENGKLYSGVLVNWYTGMNRKAFSNNSPVVIDWNVNYKFTKDLTTYVNITNLTNTGYENDYYYYNGIGARPQPGRCIMVGMKYNF